MRNSLHEHIKNIFTTCKISVPFTICSCTEDNIPEWLDSTLITHEFLVYCSRNIDVKKLQYFSGKEVTTLQDYIYWFEGDVINVTGSEESNCSSTLDFTSIDNNVEFLKTSTRLPQWLDKYIYEQLGAKYQPNFMKFEYNLDLSYQECLEYLGTYFPRSYGESFCIFDNIFQNIIYKDNLSLKAELNILTVGCGTGGDVIGLITIIEKFCPNITNINIWAIDGNNEALEIFTKIVGKFAQRCNAIVSVNLITTTIETINNLDLEKLQDIKFDYILSFKMICEIIQMGQGKLDNSYYDFIMKFMPLLTTGGLCLLLDVTTKPKHMPSPESYNPILKNSQVNRALKDLKGKFKTLLPLSCFQNETKCMERCFTQRVFYISHSRANNDQSKISYRVIGNKQIVNSIVKKNQVVRYALQKDDNDNIKSFCPCSDNLTIVDGYKLNK